MSTDLLAATMEIPFSVPPYTALLARSVASLEGIALLADPGYQVLHLNPKPKHIPMTIFGFGSLIVPARRAKSAPRVASAAHYGELPLRGTQMLCHTLLI